MTSYPYKKTLLLALCGSGFSALVLEVLWTKLLSLTFGSSIWAVGVVVATFMGGLALGGALLGRVADRVRNPLRLYAWLEFGIALSAILFRPALQGIEYCYVSLHGQLSMSLSLSSLFLLGFSALLLLPPTLCMGGTLPVLGSLLKRGSFSRDISLFYAVNVAGAAAGAFLAGYVLIPFLGLLRTETFAYGINLAIAVLFWWLGRRPSELAGKIKCQKMPPANRVSLILPGTFLAGFCALALQILWTRVLVLFLGSSTYTFSSILCVYLVSMAAGGAVYVLLQKKCRTLPLLFAGLAILSGMYVLCSLPAYDQIPYALLALHHWAGQNWWLYTASTMLLVSLVVGPPAFLSGAMFPAAMAILSPDQEETGRRVGRVVLYNTLGGVAGSLAGVFWLIPHFGLLVGFKLTAAILLLTGGIMIMAYGRPASPAIRCYSGFSAVLAITLLVYPFQWDEKLMNSGIYYYASEYGSQAELASWVGRQKLLASIEGKDATVTVLENQKTGGRFFTVNGKVDGGTEDMATQILLGQLPVLLHPDPQDLLVIGLGSGVTLGTITQFPARRIDCVEISQAVVRASGFFRNVNLDPESDARVRITIQDARNFLLLQQKKFDVITSEPSNPWQVGNANLFTLEFFRVVRERLNPGGIFCQWVPLYELTHENLMALLRTFSEVFPDVHLFIQGVDLFMVGSSNETKVNYQGVKNKLAKYFSGSDLSVVGAPADLFARHYLFSGDLVREISRGEHFNTDMFPILEYSSRYNLGDYALRSKRARQNMTALYGVVGRKKQALPVVGLGSSPEEIDHSRREIVESFARAKRIPVKAR